MTAPDLDTGGAGWNAGKSGEDIFHGQSGFAWFRSILPVVTGDHHQLHFESVDDNATVYLNGRRLAHHDGWTSSFDVSLDAAWKQGGPNNLAVLVQNIDGGGGITGDVTLTSSEGDQPVRGWKMQGGLGAINPDQGWSPAADAGNTADTGAADVLPDSLPCHPANCSRSPPDPARLPQRNVSRLRLAQWT